MENGSPLHAFYIARIQHRIAFSVDEYQSFDD